MKNIGDSQRHRTSRVFEFLDFRLDGREHLLLKRGKPVALTPKAFEMLLILVERHGHVVTKEELLKEVWTERFVEESNVTWNIHSLRRVLAESETNKFILTVPKVGFRFVAPVTELTTQNDPIVLAQTAVRPPSDGPAVAVLPFRNLDRDTDSEYFGDGLTEEVINTLAHIKGLRVTSRTSSFAFKGKDMDIRQIGEVLGVTAVLEGSVRKSATHIRITAQLINVADGYHLWSEVFERQISDIFKIQEEISHSIAEHMIAGFRISARTSFPPRQTTQIEAYNSYLLGRYFWNKRHGEGVGKSLQYFEACLNLDPNYALAYAGLADSYNALGLYRIRPPHIAFGQANRAALRAMELDAALAEPHTSLGIVHIWYEWKWYEGEAAFRRSISLNSEYATAHQWYALSLPVMGRMADGISEMEYAHRLEPLSLGIRSTLVWIYYLARDYDKALVHAQETVQIDPGFVLARFYLGLVCIQKGMFDEAIEELKTVVAGTNRTSVAVAALAYAYAAARKHRMALQTLTQLQELAKQQYVSAYDFALVYSGLQQTDAAFESLNRACDERGWLNHLNLEPMLDNLREDPRFPVLLRRMGLE